MEYGVVRDDMTEETLQQALDRYQMDFAKDQVAQLDRYCQLLWQWNTKLNLTRHTTYDKFVSRDVLDSVELGRLLTADEEVLDVGTGGGVPGIVLAILRPDLTISLSESVGKKAKVVESIISDLDLPVAVYSDRAEDVLEDLRFDTLVARAVGPLWKMCKWFRSHWHSFGSLLAIKGPRWTEERQEARSRGLLNGIEMRRVASYPMPGTHSESVILRLQAQRVD
jgi:16S rRNA (guanine527-N7)-methyltransferase